MTDFVDQRTNLSVGGPGRHDNLLVLGVAPAAGAVFGEVANFNGVAELGGVRDQRGDQVLVAVAGDRL